MKQLLNTKALKVMWDNYHRMALREMVFWLESRPKQLRATAPGALTPTPARQQAKVEFKDIFGWQRQ